MRKRSGIFGGWIILLFVVFLANPLTGRATLSKSTDDSTVISDQTSMVTARQALSSQAFPPGNVKAGQDLFMGYSHFKNGGPPCMGCHNVGSNGLLGGGAMGPDLTNVSTKRTSEEIASILSNSGSTISPVMQPIFTEHPLTESEQADLIAFLNASTGQPDSNKEFWSSA